MLKKTFFLLLVPFCQCAFGQQLTLDKAQLVRKGDSVFFEGKPFTGKAVEKKMNDRHKAVIVGEELYTGGIANGTWREWYSGGEKKFEGTFKNGKGDGDWIEWNADGSIRRKLSFDNGIVIQKKSDK